MSLYGMMFGQNPIGPAILATLGLTPSDVGRYRDCYVSDGKIAVYTRNGGGNRECWRDVENDSCDCTGCFMSGKVQQLPYYSHDVDDEFDCTYATIYFTFPPEYAEELKKIELAEPFDPSKRWLDAIEALKAAPKVAP